MTPSGPDFKRPALRTHPGARLRNLFRRWPFLVWVLLILVTIFFYLRSTRFVGITGVVDTPSQPVASLSTGRLVKLFVKPGDPVKAGDPLAQMDTTIISTELAQAESEMAQAETTLQGAEATFLSMIRSFDGTVRDSEAKLAETEQALLQAKTRLAELKEEQARRDRLKARGLLTSDMASELKPEIGTLTVQVSPSGLPSLIAGYTKSLADAKASQKSLLDTMGVEDDGDVMAALKRETDAKLALMQQEIDLKKAELEACTLRAAGDGIVSQIFATPGDVIPEGQEVIKIVGMVSDTVIGFLHEVHLSFLNVGDPAYISRETGGNTAVAKVVSISPEIDDLPGRMSALSGQVIRGRRVIFKLRESDVNKFLPGETVNIRSVSPFWFGIAEKFSGSKPDTAE